MALILIAGEFSGRTIQDVSLQHRTTHTINSRQRAEIQLRSLLNDPHVSLPACMRHIRDHHSDNPVSIEQAAKLLNAQPFLIERLANALFSTVADEKRTCLSALEAQKLTRVLNGTVDVRSLLLFMMLDENHDGYVTRQELSQFYEQYLKGLKTFDSHRQQAFIDVLSQKFQLNQPVSIDRVFGQRRTGEFSSRMHASISSSSIPWCATIRYY
jgi:hypothetical protein